MHLGAALWNRGNVLLGIYGQWHGHPSGDRRRLTLDLGLALSHDALQFVEPIPGFRFIPAREQPESPRDVGPALQQGQGMANLGDRTLYWYSLWRGTEGSGVRMVAWERDRLGLLTPITSRAPRAISCPLRALAEAVPARCNASGLGAHARLRIALLDAGFRPIPGYSPADTAVVAANGFDVPLRWGGGAALPSSPELLRFGIHFEGVRPEDARLHAVYVGDAV